MSDLSSKLESFARLELMDAPTPIQHLARLSDRIGRDVYVKRDDLTPLAMGGNKLRKLEYLAADALQEKADVLVTAGAIQSNHVRQTAALAGRLGLDCVALLENPIDTESDDYLQGGNRLLLDLFRVQVRNVRDLDRPVPLLDAEARQLIAQGRRPYIVPIGGSNALGALGYVRAGLEIEQQMRESGVAISSVVVASGSAGTQAGLALALAHVLPEVSVIGVTVSRAAAAQAEKVHGLVEDTRRLLDLDASAGCRIALWDEYYAPRYGEPNARGIEAIRLLAEIEGLLLDPVYSGKAMAGLLDGVKRKRFPASGGVLFWHTGGTPALFAYKSAFGNQ